jgi:hypothetical protein
MKTISAGIDFCCFHAIDFNSDNLMAQVFFCLEQEVFERRNQYGKKGREIG